MTDYQLHLASFTTTLWARTPSQPFLPSKSISLYATGCQLLQENAVGDCTKGFTTIQAGRIHSLSLIHQVCQLIIEGDHIGLAGTALYEPLLVRSDLLEVPHMLCDHSHIFCSMKFLDSQVRLTGSLDLLF